jgi:CspA family cold shock protein
MGKGRDYRGPKRRGFDDDMFSLQDARDTRSNRPSYAPQQSVAPSGPSVDAVVKWFNSEKGFGFVELGNGSGDAFLHIAVLQAAGHESVQPGAKLKVQTEQGKKGLQVSAVLEVDATNLAPVQQKPRARSESFSQRPDPSTAVDIDGTVKWFNPEKGFGFVSTEDGGKDVFLHISVLEKLGRKTIAEGEFVTMQVVQGQKGREAISITIVPPIG